MDIMHYQLLLRNIRIQVLCTIWVISFTGLSCQKYLDKKPVQNIAIPTTLGDLQAVLDNQNANNISPYFNEVVADNYYITTASWNGLNIDYRSNYVWAKDATFISQGASVWNNAYQVIYESNFVLDGLENVDHTAAEAAAYNNVKGTALFYRSFMFHQLAQLFCKPYSTSSGTDMGIVLRTTSLVESPVKRSTVQETYDQIISDLKQAGELLPEKSLFPTRPGKAAAYGLLARVYLSMREYSLASTYANMAINGSSGLLDYSTLTPASDPVLPVDPFKNPEILFLSSCIPLVFNSSHMAIVDSLLFQSYDVNDLRKTVFYGGGNSKPYWKGSYSGSGTDYKIFTGIATDEQYLIRAECRARAGNTNEAMADLNILLKNRWKTNVSFVDRIALNATDALSQILVERRKELAFRGLRWSDLRRLNLEGANITIQRIINGTTYSLPPNDPRWVLLIPEQEVSRSNIPQNQR
jgi:tetratricopeptide (TPR) repeat protein